MSESRTYDVVVLGAGAVGENAADRAGRTGLSVVIVESALVGGECSYWACMPSKALLRPGQVLDTVRGVGGAAQAVTGRQDVGATLERRDTFTHDWDDSSQVSWLQSAGIDLVRGEARFTGERTVEVSGEDGDVTVTARHAVIAATGSEPVIPAVDGLAQAAPWTSREATSAQEVPPSLVILGGGVVGAEMAVAYADLGSSVTLLHRGDRLLANTEPFASDAVAEGLMGMGVDLRLGTTATRVERDGAGVTVHHGEGEPVRAAEILVATGRRPRTDDLGLETIGLTPGDPLTVDDQLQVRGVAGAWLYAVGDVTGRVGTTHQGKYDARVAGDVVAARFGQGEGTTTDAAPLSRYSAGADHVAQTQVVFTRPEVAWVGRTEAQARAAGIDVRLLDVPLSSVAGTALHSDHADGRARLVVDGARDVVVGATFVGPDVAELLHAATIAVVGEVPLDRLWHAVPAYPTVSEVWLRLLESAGL
ncbi:NAD(P)/FAD-dependent oxidoreductase [Isoptericola sp. b441]|uniref:NAD(P)/FAD-dependent oxidoreductase n=1 Tax=Actinotalea lenta TaxID=3064654 RepID=A0ABT9D8H1_9CELL|nr:MULTISPECIES: NAD(P)/FAD-dependent oxidoreductase [unclassified Isoptericola]MDO8107189.1 NAD(P)/FAD-dependent oxidoreductase [Isoptericola sp. b441]MDO8121133.1 NAD(P)/FAD-dependent oxidoreductase [Isoptericola sp. b490]